MYISGSPFVVCVRISSHTSSIPRPQIKIILRGLSYDHYANFNISVQSMYSISCANRRVEEMCIPLGRC